MKTRIIVDSTLDMTESFCRRARVIRCTIILGRKVLTDGVTDIPEASLRTPCVRGSHADHQPAFPGGV